MTVLDEVTEMKNQGFPEEQIIGDLQEKGYSPREIDDAINQSQIKNAVMAEEESMDVPTENEEYEGGYSPQTQEMNNYSPNVLQQGGNYDDYPQQAGYDNYEGGGGYAEGGQDNTIEIVEQVFAEKIKKTEKKLNELSEFKILIETKVDNLDDRLKRIEKIIDQLQIKIIDQVGGYGKELDKAKREISMVQDSFGKMVNKIADNSPRKKVFHKKSSKKE